MLEIMSGKGLWFLALAICFARALCLLPGNGLRLPISISITNWSKKPEDIFLPLVDMGAAAILTDAQDND